MAAVIQADLVQALTICGFNLAQRNLVVAQGIELLDDVKNLTQDEIKSMCTNIHKNTSATVPFVAGGVDGGRGGCGGRGGRGPAGPVVHAPIVTITATHERNLKLMRFYLLHLDRTQRPFVAANIDNNTLLNAMTQRDIEEYKREHPPKLPEKMKSVLNIRAAIEDIENYLGTTLGMSGTPLAYVTRETVAPVDDDYGGKFDEREMIMRAPHTPPYYMQDNSSVWSLMRAVLYDTDGWSWISQFERLKNGRGAYMAVKDHYLGTSNQSRIKMLADKSIENTFFDGEKRGFTFEKYCSIHKQAHKDLADYGEVLTEDRKVRRFLQGIRANFLQAAVTAVFANPTLVGDFDATVNFISNFAARISTTGGRNVSGAGTGGRGKGRGEEGRGGGRGGRGRGRGRGGRAGRGGRGGGGRGTGGHRIHTGNYSNEDWTALSPDEKQQVYDLREKIKRTVSAANSGKRDQEDMEPAEDTTASVSSVTVSTAGNAGSRMSQRQKKN